MNDFQELVQPIISLINSIITPALMIVSALGALYCVVLGVKFAKAEEPQEHEKAKNHLKNAILGYIMIFVLMLMLKLGTPILQEWFAKNTIENFSNTPAVESIEKTKS